MWGRGLSAKLTTRFVRHIALSSPPASTLLQAWILIIPLADVTGGVPL